MRFGTNAQHNEPLGTVHNYAILVLDNQRIYYLDANENLQEVSFFFDISNDEELETATPNTKQLRNYYASELEIDIFDDEIRCYILKDWQRTVIDVPENTVIDLCAKYIEELFHCSINKIVMIGNENNILRDLGFKQCIPIKSNSAYDSIILAFFYYFKAPEEETQVILSYITAISDRKVKIARYQFYPSLKLSNIEQLDKTYLSDNELTIENCLEAANSSDYVLVSSLVSDLVPKLKFTTSSTTSYCLEYCIPYFSYDYISLLELVDENTSNMWKKEILNIIHWLYLKQNIEYKNEQENVEDKYSELLASREYELFIESNRQEVFSYDPFATTSISTVASELEMEYEFPVLITESANQEAGETKMLTANAQKDYREEEEPEEQFENVEEMKEGPSCEKEEKVKSSVVHNAMKEEQITEEEEEQEEINKEPDSSLDVPNVELQKNELEEQKFKSLLEPINEQTAKPGDQGSSGNIRQTPIENENSHPTENSNAPPETQHMGGSSIVEQQENEINNEAPENNNLNPTLPSVYQEPQAQPCEELNPNNYEEAEQHLLNYGNAYSPNQQFEREFDENPPIEQNNPLLYEHEEEYQYSSFAPAPPNPSYNPQQNSAMLGRFASEEPPINYPQNPEEYYANFQAPGYEQEEQQPQYEQPLLPNNNFMFEQPYNEVEPTQPEEFYEPGGEEECYEPNQEMYGSYIPGPK